jgi:hypothetical protein
VLAEGAVRLVRRFPDNKDLAAHAVAAVLMPGPGGPQEPLGEDLRADVQAMIAEYVRRWPEGAIRAVTVDMDDPGPALAQMGELFHGTRARPQDVPDLLAAARAGLSGVGPHPDVLPDPLYAAVTTLRDATEAALGATEKLAALFSELDPDDQETLAGILAAP